MKNSFLRYRIYLSAFLLLLLASNDGYSQIITTVAGNGSPGYTGDGGPATAAEIYYDWSVSTDYSGNFYLAGWYSSSYGVVRKVDAYGIINRFAGNGTTGFSGDGGPATAAQLYYPYGSCSDPSGNIYICDAYNWRIRKVNTSGIISTYAGNGTLGYSGDGGPATAASIGYCWGITCDGSGNVYVSDWSYRHVRRIDASTHVITTIAGSGGSGTTGDGGPATAATFYDPWFLACDPSGNVYISDWGSYRVRKIDMSTGIINAYAGTTTPGFSGDGGPASTAQMDEPAGIAIDAAGNLYVSDWGNERVRKVNASGVINTIAGNGTYGYYGDGGPATAAEFKYPYGVAVDGAQNVYVADYDNWRIRMINGRNRAPYFTGGHSLNITVCGNTVGDSLNSILPVYDSDNYQVETWSLIVPAVHGTAVCADTALSTGSVVPAHKMYYSPTYGYVGLDSFKVRIFDGIAADTTEVHVTVNAVPSAIYGGSSCWVGGSLELYDTTSGGTWSSVTTSVATVGSGTGVVSGLSAGSSVVSYAFITTGCAAVTTVNVLAGTGQLINTIAGNGTGGYSGDNAGALSAEINSPFGAAVDASGNVYIADKSNNRVRKVSPTGIITTVAGNGSSGYSGDGSPATAAQINSPYDVAVDAYGNVYIADAGNNRVRKVSPSGIISTVAGNGSTGYGGDGSPATAANVGSPSGLAVDLSGNLYISSDGTHIRKVNSAGIISTFAGNGSASYGGDGSAATIASLHNPVSVAVDVAGNVYIADQLNNRIRKVNTAGIINTIAGNGTAGYAGDGLSAITSAEVNNPWGIAVDGLGNVYIGDHSNNRVRMINTTGIINTVAGNGTAGYSGDACAATASELNTHWGICVDGMGQLYIADGGNNRVRKVTYNHAPYFTGGHIQNMSACQGSTYDSLNSLLSIYDADNGQGETWSAIAGPYHGSVGISYTGTSGSDTVTPVGLWYTPVTTYSGRDSFKVKITDCAGGTDTTWIKVTVNPPPAPITGTANVCVGVTTTLSDIVTGGTWSSDSVAVATVVTSSGGAGVVTGVRAGVAVITYSPGAGCSATMAVTVNASPAPVVGSAGICYSNTVVYSDATAGGTWSSSASGVASVSGMGSVYGATTGTATITYTVAGCPSLLPVTVNPLPGTITGPSSICQGSANTLLDGGGGTWTSGNTAVGTIDPSTGIVGGVAPGSVTIIYTLPTGCQTTTSVLVYGLPDAIHGPSMVCVGGMITLTDSTSGGIWSSPGVLTSAVADTVTGDVTGVSLGTATISYTIFSGCAATYVVTVNSSPTAITGASEVCAGTTDTLGNTTSGGVWTSSNPSVATVGSATGIVNALTNGTTTISYVIGSCDATMVLTVDAVPSSIGGGSTVCVGLTSLQTDGGSGTWSMSPSAVGTISTGGMVTGVGAGSAVISYTNSRGCSATKTFTVNTGPAAISGVLSVCAGSATVLSDATPGGSWSSTGSAVSLSSGTVSGISAGTALVDYSLGVGCSVSATVTVNAVPAAISPSGSVGVCVSSTTILTETTGGGTWSSTSSTIALSSGTVMGSVAGPATVSYTMPSGCYVSKLITVNPLPGLIGGPSSVCSGGTITETDGGVGTWSVTGPATIFSGSGVLTAGSSSGTALVTFTLSGTGCARTGYVTVNPLPAVISGAAAICPGNTLALSGPSGGAWSTTSGYATVVGSTGVVTGSTAGSAIISYTLPTGCYRTATVTVNAAPSAIGGPSALCASNTIYLIESGGGSFTSGTPTVATVGSSSGVVNGLHTGTTVITYTLPTGCSTTETVTVSSSPTAITGLSTLCTGATDTLTDTIGGGVWSVASGAVSVGSLSGVVTGSGTGVAMIDYSLGTGCTVSRTVTVSATPAAISGGGMLCSGTTIPLTETTLGGGWLSSATGIATVSGGGVVSGVTAGVATIDYITGGCYAATQVTVNTAPAAIGGPGTLCAGATVSETESVSGGIWSTSSGMVSIGSTGSLTASPAIAVTTAVISYGIGSCSVNRTVTVNPEAGITGPAGLCTGTTITLSDAVSGGSWSASPGSVATISGSGILNGVTAGVATVSYTTAAGCRTTTMVTVNNTPGPVTGAMTVCAGGSTTLGNTAGGGIWSTAATTISIGSSSGIVTGATSGTAPITYSLGSGCTVYATVTVIAAPSALAGGQVCQSGTTTLSAGSLSGGLWSAGAGASVGSTSGVVTGISAGTTAVSYTLPLTYGSGCVALAPVTVNALPDPITGTTTLCEGTTGSLIETTLGGAWTYSGDISGSTGGMISGVTSGTGTATYTLLGTGCATSATVLVSPGPSAITGILAMCAGTGTSLGDAMPGGRWVSDAAGIATVGSASGAVSGLAMGTADITYSIGGCYSTTQVTVTPLPGAILGNHHGCVALPDSLSDATAGGGLWTSSNTLVATAGSVSGVLTGVSPGTVVVTYSLGTGCTVSTEVSIDPSPSAITGPTEVCLGATALLHESSTGGAWSSNNNTIATITTGGVVSGASGGTVVLSYTSAATGCAAVYAVDVISVPAISGLHPLCAWGDTLAATESYGAGTWSSTLVTVGSTGVVLSFGPGVGTVTFTEGHGCHTTSSVTINPDPAYITGDIRLCNGLTTMLVDTTIGGVWSTAATTATVSSTGLVTGTGIGTALVSYTLPTGCLSTTTVTINALPSVITGTANVCSGAATSLYDSVSGGSWSSSSTSVAPVSSSGVISGMRAGTATITYSMGASCTATRVVTVDALPVEYTVTGGGNYCAGGSGVHVGLSGSAAGTSYSLYDGSTLVGTALTGTGHALDLGLQTAAGTYTVLAQNAITGCGSAMSDSVMVVITATVAPMVALSATPGEDVCAGTAITFSASATNGGTTPGYTWQVNGSSVSGATSATYSYTPSNGDIVTMELTSSAICATPAMVSSNIITVTVNPELVPVVSITGHPGTTITTGQNDTLTATITGAGTSPTIQWEVNGIPVAGANGTTWIATGLQTGDTVTCEVTSNGTCGGNSTKSGGMGITVTSVSHVGVAQTTAAGMDITVVPNPNKGMFTVKGIIGTTDEDVQMVVTDVLGQTVYTGTALARGGVLSTEVHLSSTVANGMYLLSLHTVAGTLVFHVVVEQ
jgi:NHL repeat